MRASKSFATLGMIFESCRETLTPALSFISFTMPSREALAALERAEVPSRGMSYYQWLANALNSLFERCGVKGKDGRGASPAEIQPDTIRHGERNATL